MARKRLLKNGSSSWEVSFQFEGKQYKRSGKTKAEAQAKLDKLKQELVHGSYNNTNMTFIDAAEIFMNLHAELHCKASTLAYYHGYLKNHIIPFFGSISLRQINPNHINEYISEKIKTDLSYRTINHHLTIIHTVLQKQVEAGILLKNPSSTVKKLKVPYQEMSFLTKQEVVTLLKTCKKLYPEIYALISTAIFTGMRQGELLALTWQDINFQVGKINVNKTLYKKTTTAPKSEKSRRQVDLTKKLSKTLQEHKLKTTSALVFPNKIGGYQSVTNLTKRKFKPLLEKAAIKNLNLRFHDLRHTYASLLLAENTPIKYIQAQMGHSSIQVTMDKYAHLLPEIGEKAVQSLDSLFDAEEKKQVQNYNF